MKIWVDADACPGVIKDILFRAANRTGTLLTLVANQQFLPRQPRLADAITSAGLPLEVPGDRVRIPYFRADHGMLAKLTSKNQLTLPKSVTQAIGPTEYFQVETDGRRIILTPVRIQAAEAVREKLAELDITERDITDAVDWARQRGRHEKK